MSETNPFQPPIADFRDLEPPVIQPQRGPEGIGGWLVLLAIGLVLSPIRLAFMLLTTFVPLFTEGTWDMLTTPGSPYYNAFWGPILIFEIVGNLLLLCATIWLLVTFFGRKRIFPKSFIAFAVINVCFVVFDAWLASIALPNEAMFDESTISGLIRPIVWAAIWVPYMLASQRVKNTFVQ